MSLLSVALFSAAFLSIAAAQGGHHHEYRKYTCLAKRSGPGTDCTLTLKKKRDGDFREFTAPTNQECFEESHKDGRKVYCPLYCPETVDAYAVAKAPPNNHKCVNRVTYSSELRNGEWYLWRSGSCADQEITFEYGCHFTYPIEKANVESFYRRKRTF